MGLIHQCGISMDIPFLDKSCKTWGTDSPRNKHRFCWSYWREAQAQAVKMGFG